MTEPLPDWTHLLSECSPASDPREARALAAALEARGAVHEAAAAWDRAYGLDPEHEETRRRRQVLLDSLAVELCGLNFRYIPAGTFLMGSDDGDWDEAPIHAVRLDPCWLQEAPISWDDFLRIQEWEDNMPPSDKRPKNSSRSLFHLYEDNKIRRQYCEDGTLLARDWHAHLQDPQSAEIFGVPPRDESVPHGYKAKPMVSIGWQDILPLAYAIEDVTDKYFVDLPTEAQWERGARGGLIARRYPWGDAPPSHELADFDHFGTFVIQPSRRLPPNDYGLYGMAGGVWEWCADWYDAEAYARRQAHVDEAGAVVNPRGPRRGLEKVLRGGSWADCADALRVSFRHSRNAVSWTACSWGGHNTPNLGARLALRSVKELI